jgi:hypothetical protein
MPSPEVSSLGLEVLSLKNFLEILVFSKNFEMRNRYRPIKNLRFPAHNVTPYFVRLVM